MRRTYLSLPLQLLASACVCALLCLPWRAHAIDTQIKQPNQDEFSSFELSIDALSKQYNGNVTAMRDRLQQLEKLVQNDTDFAVMSAYQCELFRATKDFGAIEQKLQDLNEKIAQSTSNNDLRTATELCHFFHETEFSVQALYVAKAYQFGSFARSAILRFITSAMYIELTATQGRASDAVRAAQTTLTIAEANNDSFRKSLALRAMAAIELDYGDKEAALDYIDQTIALAQTAPNRHYEMVYRINRASVILSMKRLLEARSAVQAAEQFANEINKDLPKELINPEITILNLANMAELAYLEGNYAEARKRSTELQALAKKNSIPLLEANADISYALASVRLGTDAVIETHFKKSIQSLIDLKRTVEVRDAYEKLADALASIGKYKEAYYWRTEKDIYNQNLARESRNHRAAELREFHQASQREKENSDLKALNSKQQAEVEAANLRLQRWWLFALVLAMALAWTAQMSWMTRRRNSSLQDINRQLDDQRSHDALTGLCNRRYLMQHQQQLWADTLERSKRGQSSAMLLIDADHFKHINDRYGHAAGDAALVEIARRLKACLRDSDVCVRWGGEEFLVYIEQSDHQNMSLLCNRIMQEIRGTELMYDQAAIVLSVSIAYLMLPIRIQTMDANDVVTNNTDFTLEDNFKLVDATLYLAKQLGRNRAVGLHAIRPHCREKTQLLRELNEAWQAGEVELVISEGPTMPRHLHSLRDANAA